MRANRIETNKDEDTITKNHNTSIKQVSISLLELKKEE